MGGWVQYFRNLPITNARSLTLQIRFWSWAKPLWTPWSAWGRRLSLSPLLPWASRGPLSHPPSSNVSWTAPVGCRMTAFSARILYSGIVVQLDFTNKLISFALTRLHHSAFAIHVSKSCVLFTLQGQNLLNTKKLMINSRRNKYIWQCFLNYTVVAHLSPLINKRAMAL